MYTVPQFLTFLWCLFQLASQPAKQPAPSFAPAKDIGPEYIEPADAGPATIDGIHYAYVATKERESQIIDGFKKLKLGMSREDARRLLGRPDSGQADYPKERNRPMIGWSYLYRIRYRDKTGSNVYDPMVELFFNPDGKLHWAATNVPGLHDVGGYQQEWRDEAERAR